MFMCMVCCAVLMLYRTAQYSTSPVTVTHPLTDGKDDYSARKDLKETKWWFLNPLTSIQFDLIHSFT